MPLLSEAKKVILFLEIGRVKFFYHSSALTVECVSEYLFLISRNKQTSKKNKNTTKEEKRMFPENRICGRPGDDFCRHSHFRNQEYFIFLA